MDPDSSYASHHENKMSDSDSADEVHLSGASIVAGVDEFGSAYPPNPFKVKVKVAEEKSTIIALLDAYGSLSVPRLLGLLAANFTHRVLPESLGMPARDKEAFAQHAAGIFAIFESFRMVPVELLKMEGWRETWVVSAYMKGVLKEGKGEWTNECVMIVKMDDDGVLVEEIQEFVDSARAVEMKKRHAPKGFGGESQGTATIVHGDGTPGTSLVTTFCCFLICVWVAKLGSPVLALLMFWGLPKLEAFM